MKDVKKKITIGFLSTAIVVTLGFNIYTSFLSDDDEKQTSKTEVVDKKEKADSNSSETSKEKVILNPMNGEEDPIFSEEKEELSRNDIMMTENDVRRNYREFKVSEGLDILDNLAETSKFTDDAEVLADLQNDGTVWMNIFGGHEENGLALINGFQSFKDPETLLLAVLHLDYAVREHVVLYGGSLNPIFEEDSTPTIINVEPVEVTHEIGVMYPDVTTLHKVQFAIDGYGLDAYVLENEDGYLQFYTIEDTSKKAPYYTLEQWTKINKNMKDGKSAMDGVLDMYGESGIQYVGEPTEEKSEEVTE